MKQVKIKLDDARGVILDLNQEQAVKVLPLLQWHIKNLKVTIDKDFRIGDKVAVTTWDDRKRVATNLDRLKNVIQGVVTSIDDVKSGIVQIRITQTVTSRPRAKGKLDTFHGSWLIKI